MQPANIDIPGLLEQAAGLRRRGALADAVQHYRWILLNDPRNVDALYYLAQLSCQQGDLSGGADLVCRAIAVNPQQGRLHNLLGMALSALGRPQEALVSFDRAIAVSPQLASAHGARGDALMTLGRIDKAIESYDRSLEIDPSAVEAWCNRGAALQESGKLEMALASYAHALALRPDFLEVHLNIAVVLSRLGRYGEALVRCDEILAFAPDCAQALVNKGHALRALNRFEEAASIYSRALSINPTAIDAAMGQAAAWLAMARHREALAAFEGVLVHEPGNVEALSGCGFVLNALDRPADALSICDRVLTVRSDHVDALNNRGTALCLLRRYEEGLASYSQAVLLAPDNVDALANRAYALNALGRSAEALANCDQALARRPDCIAALNHRGVALTILHRFDEALATFDSVLAINPDEVDALNNRAGILFSLNRFDEALAGFEAVLRVDPAHVDALYNRGVSLYIMNHGRAAAECFEQVVSMRPGHGKALVGRCMAQLPIIYSDADEIDERRAGYERVLSTLRAEVESGSGEIANAVGSMQPFYLSYQGRNDRDLQRLYGETVCQAMAGKFPAASLAPAPKPGEPLRVGVVSGFFFQHSVWKCLVKGWMCHLDRNRFRLFGYYTATTRDPETAIAEACCERFVYGPLPVERWRELILRDSLHLLLYPEIGMDPVCPQLAGQRLAPVQCNSWGHPDTSGFPTLDYFISSDLTEPAGAQGHYTERLIRLPNLSAFYEPPDSTSGSELQFDFGMRPDAIRFWSPQSLYKYLPQFDWIFPRIAREVGACQFIFIQDKSAHVTEVFRKRLDRAFSQAGMNAADYCLILPRMDQTRFNAAMRACDIFLDNPEWSGCTTILESLPRDLPIVTMAGRFMRGRHASAFLRMMGVNDTIADSMDGYIATAVRLALDISWHKEIQEKIRANKFRVYRDRSCIAGIEAFLDQAVRGLLS